MSHFVLYNEWEKINPEIRDLGSGGIETVLGLLSQSSGEVIFSHVPGLLDAKARGSRTGGGGPRQPCCQI